MTIQLRRHGTQDEPLAVNLQRNDVAEGSGYHAHIDDHCVAVDIESYDSRTRAPAHLRQGGAVRGGA
jgi:hypothetical protein